jgi:hypothetical protein
LKDSIFKGFECVFDKFPKFHMKIRLDLIVQVDEEDIFKPAVANENLYKISNDNGVRMIKFTTSKISQYNVPT